MQQLKKMVKSKSIIALSFMVLSFAGCSKGGDGGSTPTPPTPNPPPVVITEPDIAFNVFIDKTEVKYDGTDNFPVVGTAVTINATISSLTLPKDGVEIVIEVYPKLPNQPAIFTTRIPVSFEKINTVQLTGLKPGVHSSAKVKVTSNTKPGNSSSRSFDLTAK